MARRVDLIEAAWPPRRRCANLGSMGRPHPLLLTLLAVGCAAEVDQTTATLSLSLPETCAVGTLGPLDLRVTGDFVAEHHTLELGAATARLPGLPADARQLVLQADDGAGAVGDVVRLDGTDIVRPVLMLPVGELCPLSDGETGVLPGAAVVTLDDGTLLAFGGHDGDGAAVNGLRVRRPGQLSLQVLSAQLAVPRTFATATPVGSLVVVAGGGAEPMRLLYDSYEVFDLETERFLPELRGTLATGARSGHAAVALVDGRVLIAGGVGADSQVPVDTAELLDPVAQRGDVVDGGIGVGRRMPTLLRMRSGIALLVGGLDARGVAVAEAEWFDPSRDRFNDTGAELSPHPRAAALRLPGERVAWFGCDPVPEDGPCALQVMLPSFEVIDVPIERKALGTAGLDAISLDSPGGARLRIRGRGQDGQPYTYTFDLDTDAVSAQVDRAETRGQWLLGDGVRLSQDLAGARMIRETLRSPYDDPPAELLAPDDLGVVLDARERWSVSDAGLSARAPQARFDVAGLRFDRLRASIEVDGTAELLLSPDGSPTVPVSIDATQVAIGGCGLSRAAGFPVEVRRRDTEVVLQSAGDSRRCDVPTLVGPVAVGVRAAPGARIENLSLRRR